MTRSSVVATLFLVTSLSAAGVAAGQDLGVRVNAALDRAAAELVARQAKDGSWGNDAVHPHGRTALCTYALLHAGLSKDDPAIGKALRHLGVGVRTPGSIPTRSVYETGCVMLLLNALGRAHRAEIHRLCDWLVERFRRPEGLWAYPDGAPDLSNTQFAVMGLKVGERHGYEASPRIWRAIVRGVSALQAENGAFRYRTGDIYRASMTHAGLLCLEFARQSLGGRFPSDARRVMARGHEWCRKSFRVDRHPYGRGHHEGYYYYFMYGLERYGIFFGFEKIAGHDWYREGAEELLARQHENGSWGKDEDTCFAVLFLRKVGFTMPHGERAAEALRAAAAPKPRPPRPRPKPDVPFLKTWLVAGPFASTVGEDDMLFEKHLDLKRVRPARGGTAGRRRWEVFTSPEAKIDLEAALGNGDYSTFYAATWLHAPAAGEALLWLAADDGFRCFLNGKEVAEGHHHDYSGDDHYRIPLALRPGANRLVLAVENLGYFCYFRARLSDAGGGPLPSVVASPSRKAPRRSR